MKKIILFTVCFPFYLIAQGYTSYFTGNTTNITTNPEFGVCMMGGASENDNAMRWLLQKANGGDVVVLRSTGTNGYNNYFYSQLGVPVNSVETLVITSAAGALNPYVLNKVANAEMIWFAGGNQWNYVSYFKDNALEDLLNNHVTIKHSPIGVTSAGMAILGGYYFSAQNGSVTSAQALSNPYNSLITLGNTDFLTVPFLSDVITDTHYDNPDRRGRQAVFIARFKKDFNFNVKGISSNEYVAVCIGSDGIAKVYGDYPNYQEFAYFIQADCSVSNTIENCQNGQPLTWNFGGRALKVYKVPGTMNGTNFFNVNVWESAIGSGGSWENWYVNNGVFAAAAGLAPVCLLSTNEDVLTKKDVYPNPFSNFILLDNMENATVEIYDNLGKRVFFTENCTSNKIDTAQFSSGLYFVKIQKEGRIQTVKMVKN